MWQSVFRDGLLKNQKFIVSGGGTGIGFMIAKEIVCLGGDVCITSRKKEVLIKAKEELVKYAGSSNSKVEFCVCNIRDENDVKHLFEFTLKNFREISGLINCAGGQFPSPASAISANGWRTVIDLNLNGTFLMCKYAHEFYMSQHGGKIVNILADFRNGFPGMSHTGAARSAIDNLTMTLAVEWAPCGIKINSVAPGIIFNDSAAAHYSKNGVPGILESRADKIPAGRLGTAEEVSAAVVFLLSPGGNYITGTCLRVDGGSSLRGDLWEMQKPEKEKWPIFGGGGDGNNKDSSSNSKL